MGTVTIDPITRIEGHLGVKIDVDGGQVSKAKCLGEMFRGIEVILQGRDPLDAQQVTQRICGVCPIAHGTASILAQDDAFKLNVPDNGRLIRNLILGANYLQSHILHFYHLAALDFVDIMAIAEYKGSDANLNAVKSWVVGQIESKVLDPGAPFLPRYEGKYLDNHDLNIAAINHYLQGLEMRSTAHRMAALFAGKMPHAATLVPGGVTQKVDAMKIAAYRSMLQKVQTFIDQSYIPDVLEVAGAFPEYFEIGVGPERFLSYGVFDESNRKGDQLLKAGVVVDGKYRKLDAGMITEDVKYSKFSSGSGKHPSQGETDASPHKRDAYSWLKAPRYGGKAMEVGPLARIMVAYMDGSNTQVKTMVDQVLAKVGGQPQHLVSVLGRHAARAIECKLVAERCHHWLDQLDPKDEVCITYEVPERAAGVGLTEAPRGALGHWIEVKNKKISRYQCVVPTTWNCSPRDDRGVAGPVEQALEGTAIADEHHPIEATRIVRSYDPCIACAVH